MEETKVALLVLAGVLALFGLIFVVLLGMWGISQRLFPENKVYLDSAYARLKSNWTTPIVVGLLYFSIIFGFSIVYQVVGTVIGLVIGIGGAAAGLSDMGTVGGEDIFALIASGVTALVCIPVLLVQYAVQGALALGLYGYFLKFTRNEPVVQNELFAAFKTRAEFFRGAVAFLLISLFTALWYLLLIIPGIVATLAYSMTYFILKENPQMRPLEAIRQSKAMMHGHKMRFFWFNCRFIGWGMASLVTLGVGYLWLMPYYQVALTEFYRSIAGTPGDVVSA